MKKIHFIFSLMMMAMVYVATLSPMNAEAQSTANSSTFFRYTHTAQNHTANYLQGQMVEVILDHPCILAGGYYVSGGRKYSWGPTPPVYAHWDSTATYEAKAGAMKLLTDYQVYNLPEDILLMPGTHQLNWQHLSGYPIPANPTEIGITTIIFCEPVEICIPPTGGGGEEPK